VQNEFSEIVTDLNSSMVDREKVRKRAFWSRTKRRVLGHVWLARGVILAGLLGIVILIVFIGFEVLKGSVVGKYAGLARNFLVPTEASLGIVRDNVNILLMGKGGQGHDAPDLTDTMVIVSIGVVNKKVSLISIPRDLWVDDLKAKVNTAYYYGNQKKQGGGVILAKSTVEEIVGIPINYAAVVDFNAFKDVIDVMGGVVVDVKNGFIDKQFPIPGKENDLCNGDRTFACRYETVEFKSGIQTMDGETALKFVRSRHAIGDEGTDLAREARQQFIISAIVRKAETPSVFLSPTKISKLIDVVNKNIETDIEPSAAFALMRYVFNARNDVKSYSIPSELLINPPIESKYLNQYVFLPTGGTWDEIHNWVNGVIKN
jgi:LCP family protein required for cell wall assembly